MKKRNFSLTLGNQRPSCSKCGKPQDGDCRARDSICYKCGKSCHNQRHCPMGTVEGQKLQGGGFQQRQSAQAQVYLLTRGGGGWYWKLRINR